jgi:hypothetical protein
VSKHETPMTLAYWRQIGGLLVEEFCLVDPTRSCGGRWVDALILPDRDTKLASRRARVVVDGERVILVQAKASRLGMYLMGQTLFSAELLRRRARPASVESIALCTADDDILRPLLEAHAGCRVVVMPPSRAT